MSIVVHHHWTEAVAGATPVVQAQHPPRHLSARAADQPRDSRRPNRDAADLLDSLPREAQPRGRVRSPVFAAWGVDARTSTGPPPSWWSGISDIRAIEFHRRDPLARRPVEVLPGTGDGRQRSRAASTPRPRCRDRRHVAVLDRSAAQGSAGAYWVPLGKTTRSRCNPNWTSPSFQGNGCRAAIRRTQGLRGE